MHFKVFARTMFVGTLTVTASGLHFFRNAQGALADCHRVNRYKGLNLRRYEI